MGGEHILSSPAMTEGKVEARAGKLFGQHLHNGACPTRSTTLNPPSIPMLLLNYRQCMEGKFIGKLGAEWFPFIPPAGGPGGG